MTPCEKVSQLLTLARSTPFVGERESAVRLARSLFNKHRLTDAHLRWELLSAVRLEVGPEPARARAADPVGPFDDQDWTRWREWVAREQAEQERWTRAWMKHAQQHKRAGPARPRTGAATKKGTSRQGQRRNASGLRGRQRKWVRVSGHASARTIWGVPSYTREIATRLVTFTCAWCQTAVQQQRFPGPTPAYCSADCKASAQREQTRERVRRFRERHR